MHDVWQERLGAGHGLPGGPQPGAHALDRFVHLHTTIGPYRSPGHEPLACVHILACKTLAHQLGARVRQLIFSNERGEGARVGLVLRTFCCTSGCARYAARSMGPALALPSVISGS